MDISDQQFERLYTLLTEWNKRFNLTTITERDDVYRKHFADSLSLLPAIPPTTHTVIDIGSGAGFPGLPIAMARPDLKVTLLEAIRKKVGFLETAVKELGLKNVVVVVGRAETVAHDVQYREQFDCAVARAVAALPVLAEYILPFVRVGRICIAQKSADEPVDPAFPALTKFGGQYRESQKVPGDGSNRVLILIDKTTATPKEYPRRPGIPAKRPL